jgi:hypothetical protein
MKKLRDFLKGYWPSFVHILSTIIIFITPSIFEYCKSHPVYAGFITSVWGVVLHVARSPRQGSGSQF